MHFQHFTLLAAFISGALAVPPNIFNTNNAVLLAKKLTAGTGITVLSATYSGGQCSSGYYTNGPGGVTSGAVFTSGCAKDLELPREANKHPVSQNPSAAGSSWCKVNGASFNAAVLTARIKLPAAGSYRIRAHYVFASEEYEFMSNLPQYNDCFAIHIKPQNKPTTLLARHCVTSTSTKKWTPASGNAYKASSGLLTRTSALYSGGSIHTLYLAICDAGDTAYDSAAFVKVKLCRLGQPCPIPQIPFASPAPAPKLISANAPAAIEDRKKKATAIAKREAEEFDE